MMVVSGGVVLARAWTINVIQKRVENLTDEMAVVAEVDGRCGVHSVGVQQCA
jgi:hypothetical protein